MELNVIGSLIPLLEGSVEGGVRAVVVLGGLWHDDVFDGGVEEVAGDEAFHAGGRDEVDGG